MNVDHVPHQEQSGICLARSTVLILWNAQLQYRLFLGKFLVDAVDSPKTKPFCDGVLMVRSFNKSGSPPIFLSLRCSKSNYSNPFNIIQVLYPPPGQTVPPALGSLPIFLSLRCSKSNYSNPFNIIQVLYPPPGQTVPPALGSFNLLQNRDAMHLEGWKLGELLKEIVEIPLKNEGNMTDSAEIFRKHEEKPWKLMERRRVNWNEHCCRLPRHVWPLGSQHPAR